jgi:hypothetical protein
MHVLVNAEGATHSGELFDRIRRGIEDAVANHAAGRLLACRIQLAGRTSLHDEIISSREQFVAEARAAALSLGHEGAWIERLVIRTLPAVATSALHGMDALNELQTIFAEAVNDPGLRSQFDADNGFEFPPCISLDLPGFHQPLAQAFEFFADSLFTRCDVDARCRRPDPGNAHLDGIDHFACVNRRNCVHLLFERVLACRDRRIRHLPEAFRRIGLGAATFATASVTGAGA